MKNLFKLIRSSLKVGFIGFGGGSALIPVIENELVVKENSISSDSYIRHTVISNITPGALPVKLGATCGMEISGFTGSLLSAYLIALPGALLTVLILALFSFLGTGAITYLNYASVGITIFIVYLLFEYISKTLKNEKLLGKLLFFAAFGATCGKEVYAAIGHIFGIDIIFSPLLDISMITLMLLSFYMIILTSLTESRVFRFLGTLSVAVCSVLYGKKAAETPLLLSARPFALGFAAVILITVISLSLQGHTKSNKKLQIKKDVLIGIMLFIGIPAAIIAICSLLGLFPKDSGKFLSNVALSTVTSFGGGESYIAVAESFFVQNGLVSNEEFFSHIVPIANALPGPILIKIATACAFLYGRLSSNISAVMMAICVFLLSIGCCCSIAIVIHNFYEELKDTKLLLSIKKSILPIICGSLVSTSLSMFNEAVSISARAGFYPILVYLVLTAGVFLFSRIRRRSHINDMLLLLASVVLSLLCFIL